MANRFDRATHAGLKQPGTDSRSLGNRSPKVPGWEMGHHPAAVNTVRFDVSRRFAHRIEQEGQIEALVAKGEVGVVFSEPQERFAGEVSVLPDVTRAVLSDPSIEALEDMVSPRRDVPGVPPEIDPYFIKESIAIAGEYALNGDAQTSEEAEGEAAEAFKYAQTAADSRE